MIKTLHKIVQMAPLAKSDHNTINITLNIYERCNKKLLKCYCYNKANYNILSAKLNDVDWAGISETLSVNDYWEKLKSVLINFKENSIPQFNRRKVNDLPWFNTKLKKLIKKRNNLFKRYKKNCLAYSKIKYIIA